MPLDSRNLRGDENGGAIRAASDIGRRYGRGGISDEQTLCIRGRVARTGDSSFGIAASFAAKPAPPPPPADPAQFVFAYVAEGNFSAQSLMVMYRDGSHQTVLREGAKSVQQSQPSWSPDGKYVYFVGYTGTGYAIQRMQPIPGITPQTLIALTEHNLVRPVASPKPAPDGRYKIAFADVVNGKRRVLLMNEDTTDLQVIADDGIDQFQPTWSPNADAIAYVRAHQEGTSIYYDVIRVSLTARLGGALEVIGTPTNLTAGTVLNNSNCFDPAWAHNSSRIVVTALGNAAGTVFMLDADSPGLVTVVGPSVTNERQPEWSPADDKFVLSTINSIAVIDANTGVQNETLAVSGKSVFKVLDPAWRPPLPVQ